MFQQFDCVDFDTRTAAAMVAEELVRKGMFEDAIKLFDIANVSLFSKMKFIPGEDFHDKRILLKNL